MGGSFGRTKTTRRCVNLSCATSGALCFVIKTEHGVCGRRRGTAFLQLSPLEMERRSDG
jgi:hypothetical protein